MNEKIILKQCMIFKEKNGTEIIYIEAVTEEIIICTIIDRNIDYQCQEHLKNDDELQTILQDFILIN